MSLDMPHRNGTPGSRPAPRFKGSFPYRPPGWPVGWPPVKVEHWSVPGIGSRWFASHRGVYLMATGYQADRVDDAAPHGNPDQAKGSVDAQWARDQAALPPRGSPGASAEDPPEDDASAGGDSPLSLGGRLARWQLQRYEPTNGRPKAPGPAGPSTALRFRPWGEDYYLEAWDQPVSGGIDWFVRVGSSAYLGQSQDAADAFPGRPIGARAYGSADAAQKAAEADAARRHAPRVVAEIRGLADRVASGEMFARMIPGEDKGAVRVEAWPAPAAPIRP